MKTEWRLSACAGGHTCEELDQSGNHGSKQQNKAKAWHPQITEGRVHKHGRSLQCGLELNLVSKDRVQRTPEGLQ